MYCLGKIGIGIYDNNMICDAINWQTLYTVRMLKLQTYTECIYVPSKNIMFCCSVTKALTVCNYL